MKKHFYIIVIIFFLCYPCISVFCNKNTYIIVDNPFLQKRFLKYISLLDTSRNISQIYFVIPSTGCGGCISEAELFLVNNLKSNSIYKKYPTKFIFTNITSTKLIKAKFAGRIDFYSTQLLMDKSNYFAKDSLFKSIYPKIYLLNSSKKAIVSVFEVSPNQSGIELLKKALHALE